MHPKIIDTLRILLLTSIFVMIGYLSVILLSSHQEKSIIELQKTYSEEIQTKLQQLIEPILDPENVKTSVRVNIQNVDETVVKRDIHPAQSIITTTRYQGPTIKSQHVSVLINQQDKHLENDLFSFIYNGLGMDQVRGDTLVIKSIPFVKLSLWTLGLNHRTLCHIAACLIGIVTLLILTLCFIYLKLKITQKIHHLTPNENIWKRALKISPYRFAHTLISARPEIGAFILYRFPDNLSAAITDLLPSYYAAQVLTHMSHLDHLTHPAYQALLTQSELLLTKVISNNDTSGAMQKSISILNNCHTKDNVLKKMDPAISHKIKLEDLCFQDLQYLSEDDFQTLLKYVDEQTAIMALQTATLKIHQCFSQCLPENIWNSLVQKCQELKYSSEQSKQAQQEIVDITKTLIINHLVKI